MRALDTNKNDIVWLGRYECQHPEDVPEAFWEKYDLRTCRYYLWQMVRYYGRPFPNSEEPADCIPFFENMICLLEANYLLHGQRERKDDCAEAGVAEAVGTSAEASGKKAACTEESGAAIMQKETADGAIPGGGSVGQTAHATLMEGHQPIPTLTPTKASAAQVSTPLQQQCHQYISNAESYLIGAENCYALGHYAMACFQLHQVAVQTLSAAIIAFQGYKPKTNNLNLLLRIAAQHMPDINQLFPVSRDKEARLLQILQRAKRPSHPQHPEAATSDETQELLRRCSVLVERVRTAWIKELKT